VEIFVRPMRYKGCHQALNAQVVICALFTTRNSLKLQERRKAFSPIRKVRRKGCAHNQARQPSNPFSCAAPYVPPSRFPPLEVCVRRPRCAPRHRHGAGIRKPSQKRPVNQGTSFYAQTITKRPRGPALADRARRVAPELGALVGRLSGRRIEVEAFRLQNTAADSQLLSCGQQVAAPPRDGGGIVGMDLGISAGLAGSEVSASTPRPARRPRSQSAAHNDYSRLPGRSR
jgi:hypothetical protein